MCTAVPRCWPSDLRPSVSPTYLSFPSCTHTAAPNPCPAVSGLRSPVSHSLHPCCPHPCPPEPAEGPGLSAAVADGLRGHLREDHLTVVPGAAQVRLELCGGRGARGVPSTPVTPLPAGQRKQVQRRRCCHSTRCRCWPRSSTRGTWGRPCCCSSCSSSSAGGALPSSPRRGRGVELWARGCTGLLLRPLPSFTPQEPGERGCRPGPGAGASGAGTADPVGGRGEVGSTWGGRWAGGTHHPANPLLPCLHVYS